jgi:hypothetical protein
MYVTRRKDGSWELRESASTPAGPRSRTLASFRTLTPEIVERARARASKPVGAADVRLVALRGGAPVAAADADRTAGELLAALSRGDGPRPLLRSLLADALDADPARPQPSDRARAAAAWIAASGRERGEALRDLLLLADRLPPPRTPARRAFPRIASGHA